MCSKKYSMDLQKRREFTSTIGADGKSEVASDGRTVWINRGICLARFCPISHGYASVRADESSDGLSYEEITIKHPELLPSVHWEEFLAGVKNRWGIEIGTEHKPLYI
jgi:hypothetical protein